MAHIKMSETRAEATPKEWLGVGRDIGKLANMAKYTYSIFK